MLALHLCSSSQVCAFLKEELTASTVTWLHPSQAAAGLSVYSLMYFDILLLVAYTERLPVTAWRSELSVPKYLAFPGHLLLLVIVRGFCFVLFFSGLFETWPLLLESLCGYS